MGRFDRQVAYRLFASELRNTTFAFDRDTEDPYAPQYVLTPTGAKVSRVFIVGTVTEAEDIGTDTEYWRARIADPTGTFFVYAGQYATDAMRTIADVEVPSFVAIVGKVKVYTAEDGDVRTSIHPETVNVVDADTRNRWVLETARQTLDRVDMIEQSEYYEVIQDAYSENTGLPFTREQIEAVLL